MPFDDHKNLAISEVVIAPTPADSGTTLSVPLGHGTRFAVPPFNATVWPKEMPSPVNATIIRVTSIVGDQLTFLRVQEETANRAIVVGDLIVATVTVKMLKDIESGQNFPLIDLPEGIPTDPPVNTARLYALDVNGFTQVEMRDGAAKVVRFASDNIVIAKAAGVPITRGQCVHISGAAGANPLVGLAKSDAIATMPTIGLALDSGVVNDFVRVLVGGTLAKLDTSAFAEGDRLYVSPTTAGSMTTTAPVAPAFAQRVGFVTRSHATSGEVLVLTTGVDGPPRLHASTHEVGGSDPIALRPFRQGHTWGLVGDVSGLSTLPSMFIPLVGTQVSKLVGLRTKIASGTSIGVQVKRNGTNVGSVITVTTTATTTSLGSVTLAADDELTLVLSSPVGAPTTLSATVLLEHTP